MTGERSSGRETKAGKQGRPRRKRIVSFYDTRRLTRWFAASSAILLVLSIAMILVDHRKPFALYQRRFRKLSRAVPRKAASPAEDSGRESIRRKLREAKAAIQPFDLALRMARARAASVRYELEQASVRQDAPRVSSLQEKYRTLAEQVERSRARFETKRASVAAIEREMTALKGRREASPPGGGRLFDFLRELPLLDFIAPIYRVKQVMIEELPVSMGFGARVATIDRCETCHLAVARPGFDGEEPLRTHPRATGKDPLFVSENSPHPLSSFGCTVCHGGMGLAVDYRRAGHLESGVATIGGPQEAGETKSMLPMAHIEASCLKCHRSEEELDGASSLMTGKRLFGKLGCGGCHRVAGRAKWARRGPDLRRIASKVRPEWLRRFIRNPGVVRPGTTMPTFFDLENVQSPVDRQRSGIVVEGIVSYLLARSVEEALLAPSVGHGDTALGERLFAERGCRGCHEPAEPRHFPPAPNLAGIGDKLDAGFLRSWLLDPASYDVGTPMPTPRLTAKEAADLAAYLITLRGDSPVSDSKEPNPKILDELAVGGLSGEAGIAAARSRIGSMSREEKLLAIGKDSIVRLGCTGCHAIPGFGEGQGIGDPGEASTAAVGPDLSLIGVKPKDRIGFGLAPWYKKTLPDFLAEKIRHPRWFDRDKVRTYREKLIMPRYDLTGEEVDALVTYLLGLTDAIVPMERRRALTGRGKAIAAGRRLVEAKNCRGCHTIEGRGGERLRTEATPRRARPPSLELEGSKVTSAWLFTFLKHPRTIRPWLAVRMPNFRFADEEATALAAYFAAVDGAAYPFADESVPTADPNELPMAITLLKQCGSCHVEAMRIPPGKRPEELAPDLAVTPDRLRPSWVKRWLENPQGLAPGTRMPNFYYDEGEPMFPAAPEQLTAMLELLFRNRAETSPATSVKSR